MLPQNRWKKIQNELPNLSNSEYLIILVERDAIISLKALILTDFALLNAITIIIVTTFTSTIYGNSIGSKVHLNQIKNHIPNWNFARILLPLIGIKICHKLPINQHLI